MGTLVLTLGAMHDTPAAAEVWRYLQSLGCTHTVYDVRHHDTRTHVVVITQDGHVIASGSDLYESLATFIALIEALKVVTQAAGMN